MNSPLILTVSQLNSYAKSIIEQDSNLNNVFVIGEISNYVDHYRSGHLYMSIKDNQSVINAVMFSSNASKLKFIPENGMSVIIRGRVSIYERDGRFQLYIDDMQPDGVGALALAFEQTKEKLSKAGLFDISHKKPIPRYPEKIGVISSPTGAALQDILNVLNRRYPLAEIIFIGVQVQGDSAAYTICEAIKQMNRISVDIILIARGGGSSEDLWPFNDEKLAYEIYNSKIPIISGVGHETDFTICDFVSDLRAPTPSVAAELAVPDIIEQRQYILSISSYLNQYIDKLINNKINELNNLLSASVMKKPDNVIANCEIYLDSISEKLNNNFNNLLFIKQSYFNTLLSKLDSLSPTNVLKRGYSIVKRENEIISDINELKIGETISIQLLNGVAQAEITEV